MANKIANTTPSKLLTLSDAELDKVTGGRALMDVLSKIIQAKNDMQKAIIANVRV
jgi:hypothetical protein